MEQRLYVKQAWLVTGDIVSYYANINIERVDRRMEALLTGSDLPAPRAIALAKLVRAVTHNNLFTAHGKLFWQNNGLDMGSLCSSTVANLSLACRENKIMHRVDFLTYVRYIDDIFALIKANNVTEVRHILQKVSNAIPPLMVKWNVSKRSAVYLDVQITLHYGFSKLWPYQPFRKPGNEHAYLTWSSAHPIHVKKGLVIEEATCLSQLCSGEPTFKTEVAWFKDRLLRRRYPETALNTWRRLVQWHCRFELLFKACNAGTLNNGRVIRIPTVYNPL